MYEDKELPGAKIEYNLMPKVEKYKHFEHFIFKGKLVQLPLFWNELH